VHHSPDKPKSSFSIFTVIVALILFYGVGHLTPASVPFLTSPIFSLNGPSVAYAEEDEDEEDEEDEDEEDEDEEGDGEEAAEGEEEEDLSYLTDIGPAQDHEFEEFSFLGLSNRKFTWAAAQLHLLFASFILGCPMFVVIM